MLNKKIIKNDITETLCKQTGYSQALSKKIIDDLIVVLINNIKFGKLTLKNIGSCKIIDKKERIGRNPKTKEQFIISARKTLSFIPSKKILKDLNE